MLNWFKRAQELYPVTIDYRLLPVVCGDKVLKPGFIAKKRGMTISPPFKRIEEIKKCYPSAKLTKKAQEEVKLSDLFAEAS